MLCNSETEVLSTNKIDPVRALMQLKFLIRQLSVLSILSQALNVITVIFLVIKRNIYHLPNYLGRGCCYILFDFKKN